MKKSLILGVAAALIAGAALPAAAQGVDQREANQHARIEQGVRTGELTPGEAHRLHQREAKLHRVEGRMRARNGGYLTRHQRHRLQHMANHDSRAIARLKHNDRVD